MKTRVSKMLAMVLLGTLIPLCLMVPGAGGGDASTASDAPPPSMAPGAKDSSQAVVKAGPVRDRIAREGLEVEFSARPSTGRSMTEDEISAGDYVDLTFRITDTGTGAPLQGRFPGAWMDYSRSWDGKKALDLGCKERIALYLQGSLGIRPTMDLNSYFILVMNRDATISVIDPITGITGITKLYAQINLNQPAADWAKSRDETRLFVTMPRSSEVAVVDTETFKVLRNVSAGRDPVRVALQPDGKYLWVGNDASTASESGVTVIDADKLTAVKHLPTGRGHHEIAFSEDSLHAFVSNREDGTVTVIDTQRLGRVKDIKTGPLPISMAFSKLSKALYVADGEKGVITVLDGRSFKVLATIQTKPGLGPVRFSQDGRWAVVVNSRENVALVIDPSTNRVVHTLAVGKEPYQVTFSRSFAYVRSRGTERVSMIDLSELGKAEAPPVVSFPAGQTAPEKAREISLADAIVEAPGEASALVVSPADVTVYYYMEGMNTPMGNFQNYGHMPVAVQVVDRSIKEIEPGLYASTVRIPEAGSYDLAFLLDSPRIVHCFELTARPNPLLEYKGPPLTVNYLNERRTARVGESVLIRFRLTDPRTQRPRDDLKDVYITYFVAPGGYRESAPVRHAADGIYEAALSTGRSGTHYVYVVCPSAGVKSGDLPFLTLSVTDKSGGEAGPPARTREKATD